MTTPVIITLIICSTLIVLSAISNIGEIIKRKNDAKTTANTFKKIFYKEDKE